MLPKRTSNAASAGGGIVAPQPPCSCRRSIQAVASPRRLAGAWSWNRLCAVCRMSAGATPRSPGARACSRSWRGPAYMNRRPARCRSRRTRPRAAGCCRRNRPGPRSTGSPTGSGSSGSAATRRCPERRASRAPRRRSGGLRRRSSAGRARPRSAGARWRAARRRPSTACPLAAPIRAGRTVSSAASRDNGAAALLSNGCSAVCDAALPVDQGPVAVERQHAEVGQAHDAAPYVGVDAQ